MKDLFMKIWRIDTIKYFILEFIRNNKSGLQYKFENTKEFKLYEGNELLTNIKLIARLPFSQGYSISNSNIKHLTLGKKLSCQIQKNHLPRCLLSLEITGLCYTYALIPNSLPSTLKSLILDCKDRYNNKFELGSFPSSLKTLVLPERFNQQISKGVLPFGLTDLSFGPYFNKPIDNCIPNTVKSLKLGVYLVKLSPLDIPPSVTILTIGSNPQLNTIPFSVTQLTILAYLSRPIEIGEIPQSVTKLSISDFFKNPVNSGIIPSSVTDLEFGAKSTINSIPDSVTKLILNNLYSQEIEADLIPRSVTHLSIHQLNCPIHANVLPDSIISLEFQTYDINIQLESNSLPKSLTSLKFNTYLKGPIDVVKTLPLLNELKYYGELKQSYFSNSLKTLHCLINQLDKLTSLESVTSLTLSGDTNIEYRFPNVNAPLLTNLELVCLRSVYLIPSTVTSLVLPIGYNISNNTIPQSVIELTISSSSKKNISNYEFPSIKSIKYY